MPGDKTTAFELAAYIEKNHLEYQMVNILMFIENGFASKEDGVLTLDFPKEKPMALPERKTIQIQG